MVSHASAQSVIKHPGDHPHYFFDAEPHGLLGFGPFTSALPGFGFRGTFTIVKNGFVPSINNSVGIGVGADAFFGHGNGVLVPVVMQWNFWVASRWVVFGEPGLFFGSGTHRPIDPALFAGARYHFTDRIALTMRAGYPALSVGVSFYL